jgi:allantoin racemase
MMMLSYKPETPLSAPMRIWYQSYVDPVEQSGYIQHLQAYLDSIADLGVTYHVQGITPPDRYLHRLTEFRCAALAIYNALEAERQGYDAFLQGHFQDPGLYELKAAVDIPVFGLGETSLLFACTLGRKIALITIDPYFIPMHEEQVARYGLTERVVAVQAIKTAVADFNRAFSEPEVGKEIFAQFREQSQPLVDRGVEVIIPAGGLPMLLLLRERQMTVGQTVILNGIAVTAKLTEAAVKLRRLTGVGVSRTATFARPSPEALQEFRNFALTRI